jgi:hypothetical protein
VSYATYEGGGRYTAVGATVESRIRYALPAAPLSCVLTSDLNRAQDARILYHSLELGQCRTLAAPTWRR